MYTSALRRRARRNGFAISQLGVAETGTPHVYMLRERRIRVYGPGADRCTAIAETGTPCDCPTEIAQVASGRRLLRIRRLHRSPRGILRARAQVLDAETGTEG